MSGQQSGDSLPYSGKATLVQLECMEPVFFASRELSDTYYSEAAIGNYALAYAFGWAASPYRLQGEQASKPTYREDLAPLAMNRYVLPAWPVEAHMAFRFERFNALSDSYWYAMTNNRVAVRREDLPLVREGIKPASFRPSNYPQSGRLRLIERGSRFHTLVLGNELPPRHIRLGKFMSKVRTEDVQSLRLSPQPDGRYYCSTYLNSAELPASIMPISLDVISMPPVSLVKNLTFEGESWRVGEFNLPSGIGFFCAGAANA